MMNCVVGIQTPSLGQNAAKGRFGVTYMRAICNQASVGFNETPPDEDTLAIDGILVFSDVRVGVQIKCTGQFKIPGNRTITWKTEPGWRTKWNASMDPVYFVVVVLDPDEQHNWLKHHDGGTLLSAAAFWVRVDRSSEDGDVVVPKSQRLTAETLSLWRDEALQGYGVRMGTS